jgi:hypothetical protein
LLVLQISLGLSAGVMFVLFPVAAIFAFYLPLESFPAGLIRNYFNISLECGPADARRKLGPAPAGLSAGTEAYRVVPPTLSACWLTAAISPSHLCHVA